MASLAVVACLVAACGGPTVRPVRGSTRVVEPPVEPPAIVSVLSGFGLRLTSPGRDASGRATVTIGGLRGALTADAMTVAPQALLYPIVAVSQTARGWVTVDVAGTMWRGADFVGPLEAIGPLGVEAADAEQSVGLVAVRDGRRAASLYVTDGSGPARRIDSLPRDGVLSAAFVDAQRGLAVVDGGQLALTEDGGSTWRGLDTDALGARVRAVDGQLVVSPAEDPYGRERLFVDAAGAVTRGPHREDTTLAMLDRVLMRAVLASFPAMLVPSETLVADGRLVVRPPGGESRDLWLADARTGRFEVVENVRPAADCTLAAWGPATALLCGPRDAPRALYRTEDGRRVVRIATLSLARYESPHFALDGASVTWWGWGDGVARPAEDDSASLWVARASEGWRSEPVVGTATRRSTSANIRESSGAWAAWRDLELMRLPEGTLVEPTIAEGETASLHGLTVDGLLWVNTLGANGRRALRLGVPDGELVRIDLPDGAILAAMRDARRGIAVGETLAHAWRTVDGGASWEPLEAPVRGDRAHATMFSREQSFGPFDIECRWAHCIARGVEGISLLVHGWGALVRDTEHAPSVAAARTRPAEPETAVRSPLARWVVACGFGDTSAPVRARPVQPLPGRVPEDARSFGLRAGAGDVRVVLGQRDETPTWQLFWRGTDARGPFTGSSRVSDAPPGLDDPDHLSVRVALGVTRAGVFFRMTDKVFWAPAGGSVTRLPGELPYTSARVLALDGRRAALLLAYDGDLQLFEAGPATVARVHRRRADGRPRSAAIARDRSGAPTVAATLPARLDLRVFPRASAELPYDLAVSAETLSVCAGPRASDALDVWLAEGPTLLVQQLGSADLQLDLEVSSGRACVRAIDWTGPGGMTGARLVAGAGDRLYGDLRRDGPPVAIRCALQPVAQE
ncbi:MAG: hypothetical protein IT379_40530 [Deltaproteobacteria bacterium]|nr:hypothetical protein [Deltaproteobacteria bacterium]